MDEHAETSDETLQTVVDKQMLQRIHCRTRLILAIELLERISFYSLIANLVLTCQGRFQFDAVNSMVIVFSFLGFCNVLPLFAIWIANVYSGKFNTILGGCLLYLIGTSLLIYLIHERNRLRLPYENIFFIVSLAFTSVGCACIKANISTFGVEQISITREKRNRRISIIREFEIRRYFKWFYYFINFSSLLSFIFISYIQIHYLFYGYIPITSAILLCCTFLITGRRIFVCIPPNGSYMTDIVRIITYACYRKTKESKQIKKDLPTNASLDFLDYAHILHGGKYTTSQVDIVRCVGRLIIMYSSMVIFWAVYYQMSTTFILQGQHMNLNIMKNFQIPASSLCAIDTLTLILLTYVIEFLFLPCLRKLNIGVTALRKVGVGMIFAILSMVAAALVETYRKKFLQNKIINHIEGKDFHSSDLTIAFQIPQYFLIGISEVLTSISGLEFAYSQTPKFLQNIVMGLFLATSGFGAFIGCIIIKLLSAYTSWVCNDINNCKFEYYFYFLASLLLLNLLYFMIISSKYSYVDNYFTGTSRSVSKSNTDTASEES